MTPSPRIPNATYRLQFNRGFTFRDAARIVPYLHDLGVSDLYASPYFRARAESTHGYDIADHNILNPAIGGEPEHTAMIKALRGRGMGHVLDIVPNHMGIGEPANAWWMDVLENGPASLYADYFDIDWRPVKVELRDKVLLPVLGDQYGVVLENGELVLGYVDGAFSVTYYEHRFPVGPRTAVRILRRAASSTAETLGDEHDSTLELLSVITGLDHLPPVEQTGRARKLERSREKEILKRRLAALHAAEPAVQRAIDTAVAAFNGTPGDATSFDLLDDLLNAQAYRLSYWRVAGEQINYRRFFDINDLAGIRMEDPAVFTASHRLILRLVAEGAVTGLRVDHPDGLWDPAAYVRQLQTASTEDTAHLNTQHPPPTTPAAEPLYIVVEKILLGRERLPTDWPVAGTTGYEFAVSANGLFVDRRSRRAFDEIYDEFSGSRVDLRELIYEQKKLVLETALAGELNVLAYQLDRITEKNRRFRDFTVDSLRAALREVIAAFPVYRTYIATAGEIERPDRAAIESAVARALRLNPTTEPTTLNFLRDALLMRDLGSSQPNAAAEQLAFVMKFQQITGPVMAKGVEDTVFYIYNRLISLNEVGGEPDQFGISPATFHRLVSERAERWPHTMLTTSTHDTKRSEDVRARINVLSEIPGEWSAALEQWRALNRPAKVILEDRVAPDRNEEYLLYQTLLGAWPLERMDARAYAVFRERIAAYMQKATKEAKINTSWINPNAGYDDAIDRFVHTILGDGPDSSFARAGATLRATVARFGAYNSLAQTLLKLTTPGVPDIYQGNELWDFSLVDPDNRRSIDFRRRARLLRGLVSRIAAEADLIPLCRELLSRWRDGRIKLYVTHRTLAFRREQIDLFRVGSYTPLAAVGERADHLVAFAREQSREQILVAVPRLMTSITPTHEHPTGAATWRDTLLLLPGGRPGRRFRHVLSNATLRSVAHEGGAALPVAELFADLPLALLERLPR